MTLEKHTDDVRTESLAYSGNVPRYHFTGLTPHFMTVPLQMATTVILSDVSSSAFGFIALRASDPACHGAQMMPKRATETQFLGETRSLYSAQHCVKSSYPFPRNRKNNSKNMKRQQEKTKLIGDVISTISAELKTSIDHLLWK